LAVVDQALEAQAVLLGVLRRLHRRSSPPSG
jgi:hypothetical protein